MKRKRSPKEIVWRVMIYGPAVTIALLGIGSFFWSGWEVGAVYALAALNMWLVSRQVLTNYRSGYWQGRLELILERMGAKPERRTWEDPGPWEDPLSSDEMARMMREAAERGTLGRDPE